MDDQLIDDLQAIIGGLQKAIDDLQVRIKDVRPCYCWQDNPTRWERWRDGKRAGKDLIVGTQDDVDLDDGYKP